MRLRREGMTAMVLLCCCSRPSQPVSPPASPAVEPAPAPEKASKTRKLAVTQVPVAPQASKEAPKEAPTIVDEDLKIEEREANPYSETVNLKLTVTPQVKALVTWGAKQVAHLAPGSMDTEIIRPRGGGPVSRGARRAYAGWLRSTDLGVLSTVRSSCARAPHPSDAATV